MDVYLEPPGVATSSHLCVCVCGCLFVCWDLGRQGKKRKTQTKILILLPESQVDPPPPVVVVPLPVVVVAAPVVVVTGGGVLDADGCDESCVSCFALVDKRGQKKRGMAAT